MAKGPALTYTEVLQEAIDTYHRHYEANKLWEQTRWLGQPMWKLPTDAIVLQEIIFETRPEIIIETGTGMGGSALFYASIQHLLDHGSVLTIDTARRFHNFGCTTVANRIRFIEGSSVEARTLELVGKEVSGRRCMVILDSWHSFEHVAGAAGAIVSLQWVIFPQMGGSYISKAFAIGVLGGLGNIHGALVGGLIIGVLESLVTQYVTAKMAQIIPSLTILIILLVRPTGLFKK